MLVGAVVIGVGVGGVARAVGQPVFGEIDEPPLAETDATVATSVLAALPIGLLVGVLLCAVVATAAWIAGLIFAAQRLFPEHRRGTPVLLTVATGWLGLLIAAQVARPAPGHGADLVLAAPDVVPVRILLTALAVTVAVLALAGLVFPAWDRWAPPAPAREEPQADDGLDWLPDKGA